MSTFYSLSKQERINVVTDVCNDILAGIRTAAPKKIIGYFSNTDTYIRKSACRCVGKIYMDNKALR